MKGLGQIERNGTSVDDRFVLGLQSWLKGDGNWKQLVRAIFQPAGGGDQRLALNVAESFQGIGPSKHMIVLLCYACTCVLLCSY